MADTDTTKEVPEAAVPAVPAISTNAPVEAPAAAAAEPEPLAPIIVKKIIDEGHAGAHGGAWKIALADMMTAMMAFFSAHVAFGRNQY
jgi:hypothetical protein